MPEKRAPRRRTRAKETPAAKRRPKTTTARAPRKRPVRYTAAVHGRIVDAVRAGVNLRHAFAAGGIGKTTGYDWLRLGRERPDEYPKYAQLAVDVEQAEAEFVIEQHEHVLATARSHDPQTWQASAWFLERRYPELYGRRDTTVLEGGESPIQVLTHAVNEDPEARELGFQLLERLATRSPAEPGGARMGNGGTPEPTQ